jgi:hypothetical protein
MSSTFSDTLSSKLFLCERKHLLITQLCEQLCILVKS